MKFDFIFWTDCRLPPEAFIEARSFNNLTRRISANSVDMGRRKRAEIEQSNRDMGEETELPAELHDTQNQYQMGM